MTTVFFTGSSGQGKTTTAKIVSERLQVPVWDGVSRSSPFEMGTREHQEYISNEVFARCTAYDGVHTRTPIDVLAYTYVFGTGNYAKDGHHVFKFLSTHPKIVYFPMLLEVEDDGFRPTDIELTRKVDRHIQDTLHIYGVTYLTLDLESPEERAEKIITFVKG